MKLTVMMPSETVLDQPAAKITAEGLNGAFCLLPRHVDFVTLLTRGLVVCTTLEGEEIFLAVNGGLLVKQGEQVHVSTRQAVVGPLGELRSVLEERFRKIDQREQNAQRAMARIEAGFVRRFLEIQKSS